MGLLDAMERANARSSQKKATKFAAQDARMRSLTGVNETFVGVTSLRTRDREEWTEYIWSDQAVYIRRITSDVLADPIARIPIDQVESITVGQPPKGTYRFTETALDVMRVELRNPPVTVQTASGHPKTIERREVALNEIPVLAIGNGSGLGVVLSELKKRGVAISDMTGRILGR